MIKTQSEISAQMVAQLRMLKPSISAEVGTPERLILDTVAEALAENQVDLVGLENALNIETKYGTALEKFVALFGFGRQKSASATGFVEFSRNTAATANILIPEGTLVESSVPTNQGVQIQFRTTAAGTIKEGTTKSAPVPIEAVNPGSNGNVESNVITIMTGKIVIGVTSVTNPVPTSGGQDEETDNSLKARFQNTVFRNVAGTESQFLALAVSTAYSQKANVVGPISKYQDYVQVPLKQDSESYGYGGENEYPGTPPPKILYGEIKTSSKTLELSSTEGIVVGWEVVIYEKGDNPKEVLKTKVTAVNSSTTITLEAALGAEKPTVKDGICLIGPRETSKYAGKWTTTLSTIPYAKDIWTTKPVFISNEESGIDNFFFREGVDFEFNYPAKQQGDTLRAQIDGTGYDPINNRVGKTQPNVTFTNVYTGENEKIKAATPSDVLLMEYSYTSTSSRNDLEHNVTNAVDVFVDGANEQPSSTVFTVPASSSAFMFVDNPNSMFYYENFRRKGEPTKRPDVGNILTTLFQEPVTDIPTQLTISGNNYYLGTHYWLVQDVSDYAGTVRARDGIEWSNHIAGDTEPHLGEMEGTKKLPEYKGTIFSTLALNTAVTVENYTYDRNIVELQAALEGSRQITTDTLAHKAKLRFFKFDVTVIYAPSSNVATVNENIRNAVNTFLKAQYFGAVIRLSDILQVIHSVGGVENVRWSNDVPNTSSLIRVYETDNSGHPLASATVDRVIPGKALTTKEVQGLYVAGEPTEGYFTIKYGTHTAAEVVIEEMSAANIESKLNAVLGTEAVTVIEENRSTTNVLEIMRSFQITFKAEEPQELPVIKSFLKGGIYTCDDDYFLRDDELPTLPEGKQSEDTLAGLIIRPRAQSTWQRFN